MLQQRTSAVLYIVIPRTFSFLFFLVVARLARSGVESGVSISPQPSIAEKERHPKPLAALALKNIIVRCMLLFVVLLSIASLLQMTSAAKKVFPRLVAFDLDGTIWTPDMYQLWGGGSPFTVESPSILRDCRGTRVRLLGAAAEILLELNRDHPDVITTWVSCTDEPDWAAECLTLFRSSNGESIGDLINGPPQIFKANKQEHFKRLQRAFPDIPYEDMIFFDNEHGNIRSVSSLGVVSIYCPDGMLREVWNEGLDTFNKRRK